MKVLQLSVHLFPNIGGVETHLKDLFNSLVKRDWNIFVLAYRPLSTKTDWKIFEKDKKLTILRIPWVRGFFEKLVGSPVLEFIYLVPGLFFVTPFVIFFYKPKVIHAHGLSAAVSAVFWGKLFGIRTVISLHSLYSFPIRGLYHDFIKSLLQKSDFVLSLSNKSNEEVRTLGVESKKSSVFTYWIDLEKFKRVPDAKKRLGWEKEFVVMFVGRLVDGKGIDVLLKSAKSWNSGINLVIIGSGPLEKQILNFASSNSSIHFLGKVDQDKLPLYYCAADLVIVPSTSEEGFGRVIIESLACGVPVIASRKGAIPEAMDETVGKFIDVNPKDIKETIEYFYRNPEEVLKPSKNARKFAERRYSEKNVETIIKAYKS